MLAKKRVKKTSSRKRGASTKSGGITSYSYDELMAAARAKKQGEVEALRDELSDLRREFKQREREISLRLSKLTGESASSARAGTASADRRGSSGKRSARGAVRGAVLSSLASAGGESSVSAMIKDVQKVTIGNPRAAVSVQLNSLSKSGLVTKGGGRGQWKLTAAGKKASVPI